jgi:hypothetical protein
MCPRGEASGENCTDDGYGLRDSAGEELLGQFDAEIAGDPLHDWVDDPLGECLLR